MRLSLVPYGAGICFALIVAVRVHEFRRGARPEVARAPVARRMAVGALAGGVFGFAFISAVAAALVAAYHRDQQAGGEFAGLGEAVLALAVYLVGVPVASWIGLRVFAVRPAWLAALGSWALLGVTLLTVQGWIPGGRVQAPWFYGLVALTAYAVAAAATVAVPLPQR